MAEPFQDGQAAFNAGNFSLAVKIWQPLAEQGNQNAQLGMGTIYAGGRGVEPDLTRAAGWYRKAADQGNADAQYFLGVLHLAGLGVPQDGPEALKLLSAAANHGKTESQFTLGTIYSRGQIVKQSYLEAYYWYEVAVEHFSPSASLEADIKRKMLESYVKTRDEAATKISAADRVLVDTRAHAWKAK